MRRFSAYADTIETLLGKSSAINDQHSLAAIDTVIKLSNARSRIAVVRASWDEIAAMWQLIARGIAGHAPMLDTPLPKDLHLEDTTFFYSILIAPGTRQTA